MGFIADMFSDDKGTGYEASAANIDKPITPEQALAATSQAGQSLDQQQNFLNALAAQHGIQNQSNALAQQQALATALAANNGAANQASTFNSQKALLGQQQGLVNQLQGVAAGTGPNPAQAMLANATGNNTANQAALMAGQRGAGANAGLIARQAAMQGAANQQNLSGQAANMQASQSLNALGAIGAQQQAMAQQQAAMQSAATNQVAQQASQQANVANLASQQVAQQAAGQNSITSARQAQEANLLNQVSAQNNSGISMQSNQNNANAGIANTNAQGQQAAVGGLMKSLSSMPKLMSEGGAVDVPQGDFKASVGGGSAPGVGSPSFSTSSGAAALGSAAPNSDSKDSGGGGGGGAASMLPMLMMALADGGEVPQQIMSSSAPQSRVGQFLAGVSPGSAPSQGGPSFSASAGADALAKGFNSMTQPSAPPMPSMPGGGGSSTGGGVDSGGMAPMEAMAALSRGGPVQGEQLASQGKSVPGKANVKGNSPKNDNVPALLSPGEVVIPRSVMQSKDPVSEAAKFVAAVMAKQGRGLKRG